MRTAPAATEQVSRLLKNVASDLQPGAYSRFDRSSAQQPECTSAVHEGESGIGTALPRPLAAPGDYDRRAGPPKAGEHRFKSIRAQARIKVAQ